MKEELNSYLANIEEYVFDEKKIVTCSWLAKTHGLHTNLSKQLLHTFYDQCPRKDELSLTYLLIGSPDDDGRCQVSIVKDKDAEECEASWKVITSKHIYSVQKCSDLSDLNVLYTAQKGETTDILSKGISAIDFHCHERDDALIAKLRSDALPVPSKQPIAANKKTVSQPSVKSKSPAKNNEDKTSDEVKAATSKDKSSVIPSMFKNSKPAVNKTNSTNKATEKPGANTKKPQGIGAFFSKTTNKPSKETKHPEESRNGQVEKESNTERNSPTKENKPTLNIVKEDKEITKSNLKESVKNEQESPKELSPKLKKSQTKQKTTAKKANSKKHSTKKVDKNQKKRKRLVVASDSESENSGEGEEEEMREPTPEPQATVVPDDDDDEDIICATPEPATRKRKKKLIEKTCQTPDGYLMTKKEWVEVSGSEDEVESIPEKKFKGEKTEEEFVKQSVQCSSPAPSKSSHAAKKDLPKSKKASPQKTKQASLTSFFKRK